MRDLIKLFIKNVMRFVLHVYWLFPINNKRVFFMSTMGKSYSCNPKYLYKSIIKDDKFKEFQFVWCFKNPDAWKKSFENDKRTKLIRKSSYIKYFYYLLTSKVIVYNCGGFSYAPIRKKQILIETWHGGGAFKVVGTALNGKSKSSKKGIEIASKEIKCFLSTCELQTDIFIRKSMKFNGCVLNSGTPRNDMYFYDNNELYNEVKNRLNIDISDKVVLYAPTFKGKEYKAINIDERFEVINPITVKKTLNKYLGGNWKFFTRGHQYADEIDLEGSDGDLSSYPDMQELLLIADVLITDYSSSIWDFILTNKLCILYAPDIENYKNNDRQFATPFSSWPGIHVFSNSEFDSKMASFDNDDYINNVEEYLKLCGSFENGNASEKVKDYILEKVHDKKIN